MQSLYSARFTCVFIILSAWNAATVTAQTHIYNTVADGNWTSNATWQGGAGGKPPTSGNCDCIININPGHRITINQSVNISNAKIILIGEGSEIRFSSEVVLAQTMQLNGTSSIEVRHAGANIQSKSNFLGYNGNTISINGTIVFQGYATMVNSSTRGVINGPAMASSSMSPPAFVNMILPVRLITFDANENAGQVILQWKTGEEELFDHFDIEKSADGKEWLKIGAINGDGQGRTISLYSFTDFSSVAGASYYRLKMIDIDRQFSYSKIVVVNVSIPDKQVRVHPNPATSILYVSNIQTGTSYAVDVTNGSGQVVVSRKFSSSENRISLNVGSLRPGIYFLRVYDATGRIHIHKPVVIRQ